MVQVSPASGSMHYGKSTSRQRPHNAAPSSRPPSVEREYARPGRQVRAEPENGRQVAQAPVTADAPMGPRSRRTAALTQPRKRWSSSFVGARSCRSTTSLAACEDNLPKLSRSALHRCLVRHGISRLPAGDPAAKRKRFAATTIGYVHIDACELRTAEGKVPPLPGHRPRFQVRLRGVAPARHQHDRRGFPAQRHRSFSLQAAHDPHRQGVGGGNPSTTRRSPVSPPTFRPLSWRTTLPNTSRRCAGKRPSRPSAMRGQKSLQRLRSTRTTSSRDRTTKMKRACGAPVGAGLSWALPRASTTTS